MRGAAQRSVAIVGGGLAGLAAGCALAQSGFRVRLFERRPYLGGRASSYQLPNSTDTVDNCQHVLLGCCTNLTGFYRQIGVEDKIRWYERLTFIEPGGRRSEIEPTWLPPPLHSSPAFLRFDALSFGDKAAIARAMFALARRAPDDDGKPFSAWLAGHGQTPRAIERFWKTVLVSALNEDLDRMSTHYAAQVFRESFLKSREGGRMGVPTLPLSDLYGAAGRYIEAHGGEVLLRRGVDGFRADRDAVTLASAEVNERVDYAVVAVPFHVLERMLPTDTPQAMREMLAGLETSPITGVHLWFDRPVTHLPHAVLLDRTIQWMFNKSEILGENEIPASQDGGGGRDDVGSISRQQAAPKAGQTPAPQQHIELVVSSSKSLLEKSRNEILEIAQREFAEFFPEAAKAQVVRATVIKEVHATFSVLPRADRYRPNAATVWPRVFLAGDWTATGWPATMEGAVRSGYLAAEAVVRGDGGDERFLARDLPARGLMRLFK